MERLTEDSVTGETYIKHCASSCPYDGGISVERMNARY